MQQKPTKQFIRIAIVVVLLLGGVGFAQTPFGKRLFTPKRPGLQDPTFANKTFGELIAYDKNNNNIPDWEERLYGLDPTVASTDGRSNKDIVLERRAQQVASGTPLDTANLATSLPYAIASTASILATGGAAVDQQTLARVVVPMLESSIDEVSKKAYTSSDLRIVPTTNAAVAQYTQKIQDITKSVQFSENEISLILVALQDNDYSNLGKLTNNAKSYTALGQKLVAVSVPVVFARPHLELVNALTVLAHTLEVAAKTNTDDIRGGTALAEYSNQTAILDLAMENLAQTVEEYATLQQ